MKVNILFQFKNGPFGGVNQFLKALKVYLERNELYTENIEEADIVLFNSGQFVQDVVKYKKMYPNKIFVQRTDGPSRLHTCDGDKRDYVANVMNEELADATVFQSNYSRETNHKLGLRVNRFETTVRNACDESIFYPDKSISHMNSGEKIRLIASSFSNNWNKGFEYYKYLDENLDFDRYEMTFVGNSPIEFNNINSVEALPSAELAKLLRNSDIYLIGSKKEACSNALIEAMSCGIPVVALDDGGHPEIVGDGGELFESTADLIEKIERVAANYDKYVSGIHMLTLDEVGEGYRIFLERVLDEATKQQYVPKHYGVKSALHIKWAFWVRKVHDYRVRKFGKRVRNNR